MGNRDCRQALRYTIESCLDDSLCVDIDGTRGLIQYKNTGSFHNAAGNGKSLALASAQFDTVYTDNR
jgi:hypothetical protein